MSETLQTLSPADELRQKISQVPFWWHSIDFSDGVSAPGFKTPDILKEELARLKIPRLDGQSVLDIGAWDGFFSFQAEKLGAKKVTALDHYVWSIDWKLAFKYWEDCKAKGVVPEQFENMPEIWRPKELPGKVGFETARTLLGSRVESRVGDFMTEPPESLGVHDVVFFFGVLYHMKNPFESLARLSALTGRLAIIETEAIVLPGQEDRAFFEFYETNELNGDVTNWWAPNLKGLAALCRAAGFKRVEAAVAPPPLPEPGGKRELLNRMLGRSVRSRANDPLHYRAVVHAWK